MLGKHPRDPGRLLEEEERGQLGVLHALHGPEHAGTEFALKAQYRLECQKAFVILDCGDRYAKTQLRQAAPIPKEYQCGDMVMYKREQGAEEPGSEWNGPARIIGLEDKILWMIHNGTPIVGAPNRCRPPHASELLAYSSLNRIGRQFLMPPA